VVAVSLKNAGVLAVSAGIDVLGAIAVGAGVWAGQYAAFRAGYRAYVKKRFRVLSGLMERLSRLVRGSEFAG
jgi:hypothetical protein